MFRVSSFVLRASCFVLYFFKSTETGFDGKPVISIVAEAISISFFSNDERISLLNRSLRSRISWSKAIKRSVSSSQLSVMRYRHGVRAVMVLQDNGAQAQEDPVYLFYLLVLYVDKPKSV